MKNILCPRFSYKGKPERNIAASFSKINFISSKINYKLRPILSITLIMALILLLAALQEVI